MHIIYDTREQRPLPFIGQPNVKTVKGTLPAGDYAVAGLDGTMVLFERKSVADLATTMATGRDRFARELAKAAPYPIHIVVEATGAEFLKAKLHGRTSNYDVLVKLFRIVFKYPHVRVAFCAGRGACEEYIIEQARRAYGDQVV